MKKEFATVILAGLFILLYGSCISALGISYNFGDPISLRPGETTDIYYTIQNFAGNENITIKASIIEGAEVAKITDTESIHFIPHGDQKRINVRLTVPRNAEAGEKYRAVISFATVARGEKGTFGFGSGIDQGINILVAPKATGLQEKTAFPFTFYFVAAGIAAVIILAIIFLLPKKKHAAKKK